MRGTFLIAWLAARHAGGRVILRVEDLDASRVRSLASRTRSRRPPLARARLGRRTRSRRSVGALRAIRANSALRRWCSSVSRRAESVYPCTCTRADIARTASAPHIEDEGPTYPGTCAAPGRGRCSRLADRPFCWRFRVPSGPVAWDDLFLGRVELNPAQIGGDFIVARHAVGHSYQLAVVADDDRMGVSQVIRGADLVTSTPRQILLYRQLGRPEPRFGHVAAGGRA